MAQTDAGSIPGLEKSLGEGNDYPIQGSCLENSTDGGTWWATACSIAVSWTRLKERIMKWLLAQVCGTIVNQNIFHYAPLD